MILLNYRSPTKKFESYAKLLPPHANLDLTFKDMIRWYWDKLIWV